MSGLAVGFFGKLPARGDFVRSGLPRSFVDPWDAWWQRGIAAAQDMAPDWTAAWLEAPVWRFHLPAGLCGDAAVLGVWLPSVDRAGRYFPLTIAAVGDAALLDAAGRHGFLDGAEQAGLDALHDDLEPDTLSQRIAAIRDLPGDVLPTAPCWWTLGGPRVAAATRIMPGLPEGAAFTALLDDAWAALEPCP